MSAYCPNARKVYQKNTFTGERQTCIFPCERWSCYECRENRLEEIYRHIVTRSSFWHDVYLIVCHTEEDRQRVIRDVRRVRGQCAGLRLIGGDVRLLCNVNVNGSCLFSARANIPSLVDSWCCRAGISKRRGSKRNANVYVSSRNMALNPAKEKPKTKEWEKEPVSMPKGSTLEMMAKALPSLGAEITAKSTTKVGNERRITKLRYKLPQGLVSTKAFYSALRESLRLETYQSVFSVKINTTREDVTTDKHCPHCHKVIEMPHKIAC